MEAFIERITKYMMENNLTKSQFAEMVGISEYRLNNWLNRKSKPRVNHLFNICEKTNLNADYLLGMKD